MLRATMTNGDRQILRFRLAGLATVWVGVFLFSGCSAIFVAPYDETTDRLLTDLSVRTETALLQAEAGQLSEKDQQQFFDNAIGTVRTLKARSSLFAKNEDEINALAQLEKRYESLRQRGGPLRSSVATGLRATLLDLQQIQIAKRRSETFTIGAKRSS
ncbi:MAG: hypothetical protein ACREIW_02205 [Chthoniobacterales bacterium]